MQHRGGANKMYELKNIRSIHFEITSKCQASCPMCPRNPGGATLNPNITLTEITLEQFKSWFSIDFLQQLERLNMCGNLGDPVVAKDTLEIFKYLRLINPTMHLMMHTNGSARNTQWWEEIAKQQVVVVFAIDGLEDTHSLYRIGTNWSTVIKNATAFISAGGDARWDMLVFQHNEHQVDACRQISTDLGFKDFYVKHTSRFRNNKFNVLDLQGRTTHILYPTNKSDDMVKKIQVAKEEHLPTIKCKAQQSTEIYVSATGNVSPCCWLDLEWESHLSSQRIDYMDKIGRFANLNQLSLTEIFESGIFNEIERSWTSTGLRECTKQCGSFDRLTEQFIKTV